MCTFLHNVLLLSHRHLKSRNGDGGICTVTCFPEKSPGTRILRRRNPARNCSSVWRFSPAVCSKSIRRISRPGNRNRASCRVHRILYENTRPLSSRRANRMPRHALPTRARVSISLKSLGCERNLSSMPTSLQIRSTFYAR